MAFDLVDLRLFVAVVEHGSITRGAAAVHLSLPSASTRIRAMESRLGGPLLHRHRRGATPTTTGSVLVAHARDLVERHERMWGEVVERAGTTVELHANTSAATTLLPTVLAGFLVAHPDVDVDLVQRPSSRIVAAVAEGRIELGVVADSVDLGRLDTRPLRSDRLVVVVPPGHPLDGRRQTTLADCLAHPFVGHSDPNPLQEHLHGHARPLGARPRYRARFADTESVCVAVAAGVGIAILPVAAAAGRSGVRTVALSDPWAVRGLVLCTRPGAVPTPQARALADHLLAAAG